MSAWRDDFYTSGPEPLVYDAGDCEPGDDVLDMIEATARDEGSRADFWRDRAMMLELMITKEQNDD